MFRRLNTPPTLKYSVLAVLLATAATGCAESSQQTPRETVASEKQQLYAYPVEVLGLGKYLVSHLEFDHILQCNGPRLEVHAMNGALLSNGKTTDCVGGLLSAEAVIHLEYSGLRTPDITT